MSKKVDWTGNNFVTESQGGALKQKFQKMAAEEQTVAKSNQELAAMRPQLKKVLSWFMANRKPIVVKNTFPNLTEKFAKGFSSSGFQEVMEKVEEGSVLTFKQLLKSTDQLLFENEKGEEVTIYTSDVLAKSGGRGALLATQPNHGMNGLLYNTNIYDTLLKLKENK